MKKRNQLTIFGHSIPEITVLSFGGGQDSTALLLKSIHDKDYISTYIKGKLIVVMSDTGNEHPETYENVKKAEDLCKKNGIEFYFLRPELGYHSEAWQSLTSQWERNNTIQGVAFPKSCTDNLKVKPIYKFVADYINKNCFNGLSESYRKRSLYDYTQANGKLRVIIGIAAGEENRVGGVAPHKWMEYNIERIYPLIGMKMDRKACQDYIASKGYEIPLPSNCMFCPFLSKIELLWLDNNYPEELKKWVGYESNKIENNKHRETNLGVFGKKLIPQRLAEAKEEFKNMAIDEINEYKLSHGHCITTKY